MEGLDALSHCLSALTVELGLEDLDQTLQFPLEAINLLLLPLALQLAGQARLLGRNLVH